MSKLKADKVGEIFKVSKEPTDWAGIIVGIIILARIERLRPRLSARCVLRRADSKA